MIKQIVYLLLFCGSAFAGEFQLLKSAPEKINCSVDKDKINFPAFKTSYKLYETGIQFASAPVCEKISIQNMQFFSVTLNLAIDTQTGPKNILVYEVAFQDPKTNSLRTVRSEVIDSVSLSTDLPSSATQTGFRAQWGQSAKDNSVMLKVILTEPKAKDFGYFLKLNRKKIWFENIF